MPQTIKCDLHIHSQFSDGRLTVAEVVDFYGRKGFGAIAVTDHLCEQENLIGRFSHQFNYSLSKETFGRYMDELRSQAERAREQYGMLLIPGYEITKNSFFNHRSAHILVLGTDQFIDPELSVDEILVQTKSLGAFTVAAHPFHTGSFEFQTFHLWSRRKQLSQLIDAWELNCRESVSQEVLSSGLPLIANSDLHHLGHSRSWKTRVYGHLDQESIFDSIRHQRVDFFFDS